MAGDWVKVELTTPDKPEVFKMAEILDIDPDAVTGKLLRIWIWADQQTVDGNAPGVTCTLLNRLAGVTGFAQAMQKVGWLGEKDGEYYFPNFDIHNGKGAKKRATTNRRVANHRASSQRNGESVTGSVTKSVTREEKRREENKHSSSPEVERCPVNKIIDIYNSIANHLPNSLVQTDLIRKNISSRWKENKPAQSLEFWRDLFVQCESNLFLSGRSSPRADSQAPFRASLDWIVKPNNFMKIINGNYDDPSNSQNAAA